MRSFIRVTLKSAMFLFLIVGCGYNFYYYDKLSQSRAKQARYYYSTPSTYDDEEVETTYEDTVDTSNDTTNYNNYYPNY